MRSAGRAPWQYQVVPATITNPLPVALAHYEAELLDCLDDFDPVVVGEPGRETVEGLLPWQRILRAGALTMRRPRLPRSDVHVVAWPALGYYDALTWVPVARRQPLVLVMHDIDPLNPHPGYSRAAHRAFGLAVRRSGMHVLCHTPDAADRLQELTGIRADVVPHPTLAPRDRPAHTNGDKRVVRVLGQYKSARELEALRMMARDVRADEFELEIWGRGWPAVPGWRVEPRFLDEASFTDLVSSSDVVVIPYRAYSQSGVMVRAAENAVPVVGVAHHQVEFLYGPGWPGVVANGEGWLEAARRAIGSTEQIIAKARRAHDEVRASWQEYLARVTGR